MSQFGLSPFGVEPGAFGGPGLITILGVLPAAANEMIVVFDKEPLADDPEGYDSATRTANWALAAVDPTITAGDGSTHVPDGEFVPTRQPTLAVATQDDDDPMQIHLFTHVRLEAGVRYQVTAQPTIEGAAGESFAGPATWQIRAVKPGAPLEPLIVQEDRYRDWNNDPFPDAIDQPESTWTLEPSTDIAIHDEDKSLKKRLFRRIFARPGDFSHLSTYGVGIDIKALARTGQLQTLANRIAEQARKEPDVLDVGVDVATKTDTRGRPLIEIGLDVRRRERRDTRFVMQVPTP